MMSEGDSYRLTKVECGVERLDEKVDKLGTSVNTQLERIIDLVGEQKATQQTLTLFLDRQHHIEDDLAILKKDVDEKHIKITLLVLKVSLLAAGSATIGEKIFSEIVKFF